MADKRPRPLVAIGSDVQLDVTAWLIDVKNAAAALLARIQAIKASPTWEAERNQLAMLLASRPHTKEATRGDD